jgi:type IV pilus assembly protein PilW
MNVQTTRASSGFSLLELMVAITLGLILSIGIVSLFGTTSQSNKAQSALARLQENGRYAMARIESDLRMQIAQYCSTTASQSKLWDGKTPTWRPRAPVVYASALTLPDSGKALSVNAATLNLDPAAATAPFEFSPRWFLQGYECSSGSCSPTVPTTDFTPQIPATGLAVGSRVPNTDVLTVRYQTGTGWPVSAINCASSGTATLSPQSGDDSLTDPAHSFVAGNLALYSDCNNPAVLSVASVGGTTINFGSALGSPTCSSSSSDKNASIDSTRDSRLFNMTKDFVTVTYFLKFAADANPDARKNSAASQRLIPTLVRRVNGVDQDLVQGVDRLDFLYGVQDSNGPQMRFLNAGQVQSRNGNTIACPPPLSASAGPPAIPAVPGCLWAAVRSIEVHMLVNTVDDVGQLDRDSRSFTYSLDLVPKTDVVTVTTPIPGSGLQAGGMMRREFVSLVAVRNNNP